MTSNKYYDEWDETREAILIRDVAYLTVKGQQYRADITYWAQSGERVQIVGRMTEDTREMHGGRWLYNMRFSKGGALVEHGIDFEFIALDNPSETH